MTTTNTPQTNQTSPAAASTSASADRDADSGAPSPAGYALSGGARTAWRVAQAAVFLVGLAIFALLIFWPKIGIHAFWNVLIPVAPALLAVAPGLWRNICPLGSTALLPRHFGLSARGKLSPAARGRLALIGVALLFLIVPLRHVVLDGNGPATALVLAAAALVAVLGGFMYEWKSWWCSGMCPVHPVEKLYGSEPLFSVPNAHCASCMACVSECPDATPGMAHPLLDNAAPADKHPLLSRVAGTILVGGFCGFIWGWFQVPEYRVGEGFADMFASGVWNWDILKISFGVSFLGAAATLIVFLLLTPLFGARHKGLLVRIFAAAAIGCYYWYRLPMLLGFGVKPGEGVLSEYGVNPNTFTDGGLTDGMLVDLSGSLPAWTPLAMHIATTLFFAWWLVGRRTGLKSWTLRPQYAAGSALAEAS